ncbi:hypothetical protein SODALDRAFT_379577 [Sodiomyces alkalinus F11]|uniref:Uncharacterized protein n=1 Tax=Sodiomyces alkalinus (strain CBS 110278 / VKM F-3762 / F11) TaxID=1314773 RepID=A0A3N2PRF8_SODAK|nr:hypothetical protein SODALDRAFT_379577 [Sodiomyces alkalinus F11]ROT37093.1 hypothetical protein SODALDRAFT_379577 [Sodiomyces alkalinus F11]
MRMNQGVVAIFEPGPPQLHNAKDEEGSSIPSCLMGKKHAEHVLSISPSLPRRQSQAVAETNKRSDGKTSALSKRLGVTSRRSDQPANPAKSCRSTKKHESSRIKPNKLEVPLSATPAKTRSTAIVVTGCSSHPQDCVDLGHSPHNNPFPTFVPPPWLCPLQLSPAMFGYPYRLNLWVPSAGAQAGILWILPLLLLRKMPSTTPRLNTTPNYESLPLRISSQGRLRYVPTPRATALLSEQPAFSSWLLPHKTAATRPRAVAGSCLRLPVACSRHTYLVQSFPQFENPPSSVQIPASWSPPPSSSPNEEET